MRAQLHLITLAVVTLAATACGESPAEAEQRIQKEQERQRREQASREAEERLAKAKEEGARALAEWDSAIRDESASRRKALEAASKSRRTTNSNGVRVDTYQLKDGRVIICTTTAPARSAPIFNCDGNL